MLSDGREVKRRWSVGSSWDRARKEQRLKLVFYCRTGDESAGWGLKERRENGEGLQLAYLFPWPSLCFLLFIYPFVACCC